MSEETAKSNWTRRRVLKYATLGMATAGVSTLAYASRIEPHWVDVVRRPLDIQNLPDGLAGKTLVQISDLHVGDVVDDSYLESALGTISELKPDILVITGDFMTYRRPEHLDKVISHLKNMDRGRLATVAVSGNHDFGEGCVDVRLCDTLTESLSDIGIDVLRNESANIAGLRIFGADDFWGPHFSLEKTLDTYRRDEASLMLCHNPGAADREEWQGYQGWILSGHTHGGQCRFPFIGAPIIPVRNRRYVQGEVDLFDGRRLYINRGLGYLRRIRFNVRPEITVFTLQKQTA